MDVLHVFFGVAKFLITAKIKSRHKAVDASVDKKSYLRPEKWAVCHFQKSNCCFFTDIFKIHCCVFQTLMILEFSFMATFSECKIY